MKRDTRSACGQRALRARLCGQMRLAAILVAVALFAACGAGPQQRAGAAAETAAEGAQPKAAAYSIDSLVTLRGRVVLAHEVRSFTPEGDTTEYWIVDRSGALQRAYDSVTGGQKNGVPARAELKLRCMGPSDEGFAADYEGGFEVAEVLSVAKAEE